MGLLDEVAAEATKHKPAKCVVARWLDTLDSKRRVEVDELLGSAFPVLAMYRVIVRHYPKVFGERALGKHVGGGCCCVVE